MPNLISQNFYRLLKNSLPGFSLFIFIFFSILPLGLSPFKISSSIAIIPIFYWSIYRPDLFPIYFVFIAGLLYDLITGGPLGQWALIFILLRVIMETQRKVLMGKKFNVEWLAFIIVVPLVFLIIFIIGLLIYEKLINFSDLIFQIIFTISIYPIIIIGMHKIRIFINE
ncbi:MAG: rod shape-determining protein MreD [Rhodospirillaceae bacterium]|nr:rod shape-determining protein MreD [Rhodospirillaceae bacterium]|tara:strand:- start:2245 stop:2751 length:507 start_codon:yes stop_codon:yes gene_type:complete